jgi:hypothetical protein
MPENSNIPQSKDAPQNRIQGQTSVKEKATVEAQKISSPSTKFRAPIAKSPSGPIVSNKATRTVKPSGDPNNGSIARRRGKSLPSSRFRLNLTIYGEPAEWVVGWRERGLISTARDLVVQSLQALHDKTVERDLKSAQLKSIRDDQDE